MAGTLPKVVVAALISFLMQYGVSFTAQAQTRIALVIGQSAYKNVVQLPIPPMMQGR
jgi:hypothetical protein